MYLPLPGCVALHQNELWQHGADEAAADRSHNVWTTTTFNFQEEKNNNVYFNRVLLNVGEKG